MRRLFVAASLAAAVVLTGCAALHPEKKPAPPAPTTVQSQPLEQTSWVLVALDGQLMPEFGGPTLRLDPAQKQIFGYGGCNQLSGGYTLNGDQLSIPAITNTRMACDADSMKMEGTYLKDLQGVNLVHIDGDTLDLLQNDELKLRFRAKPAD